MASNTNSTSSPEPAPTAWQIWGDVLGQQRQGAYWRDGLTEVGHALMNHIDLQEHIVEQVKAKYGPIDEQLWNTALHAFEAGLLLGYSLRDTWPEDITGLGDWPERALAASRLREYIAAQRRGE